VRLGEGDPCALSGDGKWAFLRGEPSAGLVAVPTGSGDRKSLARGDIVEWGFVTGFPDGGRVAFAGRDRQGRDGLYVQRVGGEPLPILKEGFDGSLFASPDGRRIAIGLHRGEGTTIQTYSSDPTAGAVPIQTLELSDRVAPMGFSADGKRLFVRRMSGDRSAAVMEELDLATGRRALLREFRAADGAGVLAGIGYILVAPDGKSYAYSVTRDFSDLYVVAGVK
jgi:Tol biopolymer transport system component